jgi:hypothetical protein
VSSRNGRVMDGPEQRHLESQNAEPQRAHGILGAFHVPFLSEVHKPRLCCGVTSTNNKPNQVPELSWSSWLVRRQTLHKLKAGVCFRAACGCSGWIKDAEAGAIPLGPTSPGSGQLGFSHSYSSQAVSNAPGRPHLTLHICAALSWHWMLCGTEH